MEIKKVIWWKICYSLKTVMRHNLNALQFITHNRRWRIVCGAISIWVLYISHDDRMWYSSSCCFWVFYYIFQKDTLGGDLRFLWILSSLPIYACMKVVILNYVIKLAILKLFRKYFVINKKIPDNVWWVMKAFQSLMLRTGK